MTHGWATRTWRRQAACGVIPVVAAGLVTVAVTAAPAAAGVAPGSTDRVSVTDSGGQATGGQAAGRPSVSADGRYVAFADSAPLDPATNAGSFGVYVRDRAAPGHTVLLSRGAGHSPADGDSVDPSMSADGRYVAFDTTATNIPDGDTTLAGQQSEDVVIVDRDPEGDGRFDKLLPDGTPDYRYVVVGRTEAAAGGRVWANQSPSISADGTTIAWQQQPANEDGSATVVVATLGKDAAGRLLPPPESAYVDVNAPNPSGAIVTESFPALSADGRHVAYTTSYCRDCTPGGIAPPGIPGSGTVLLVTDLAAHRTVELDVDGQGDQLSGTPSLPAISGNGAEIAFSQSSADGDSHVVVVDRDLAGTGRPTQESVASLDNSGAQVNGSWPTLSTDGRYLAFVTSAPNTDDGADPPPGTVLPNQVVERDLVVDAARAAARQPRLPGELVSPSILPDCAATGTTCPGDQISGTPALDADGGTVAFVSSADDLVPGDTNGNGDVFTRWFQPTPRADPLDFGTVPVGGSATATVTVHQVGFGPLSIGSVTVSGGDFSVFPTQTCQNAVLHETDTCLVSIRFAPSAPGVRTGTLLAGVRGRSAPYTVGLSGGAGPAADSFRATPDPLAFPGPRLTLSISTPEAVTVTNTGQVPFTVSAVRSITGPALFPIDYTVVADTCLNTALPPGGTCAVTVVDTPHGAGIRPGALEFTDDTGGSPQLVGLTGTGTTPTIQANPAVVADGRVTTIVGHGFPAGHPVVVTLQNVAASAALIANAGPGGDFSLALPVFEHTDVGTWQVMASGSGLTAGAPVLVVLDTYQPPDFTTRG